MELVTCRGKGEVVGAYMFLVERREGRRPFESPRSRWQDNTKIDFQNT
jgi:hypothetical protein